MITESIIGLRKGVQVDMVDILLVCCLEDSDAEWNDMSTKIDILKDPDSVHIPVLLDLEIA